MKRPVLGPEFLGTSLFLVDGFGGGRTGGGGDGGGGGSGGPVAGDSAAKPPSIIANPWKARSGRYPFPSPSLPELDASRDFDYISILGPAPPCRFPPTT